MSTSAEYAPEYSTAHRVRFITLGIISGACVVAVSQLWLFPALKAFAETAHCRHVLGIPGSSVLAYGMFVGLPLFIAVLITFTIGLRGVRILTSGQVPPPGERVLKKTPIRRAKRAKLVGILHLSFAVLPIAIAIFGYPQAAEFSATIQLKNVSTAVDAQNCHKLQFKPHG